jgi:integrase
MVCIKRIHKERDYMADPKKATRRPKGDGSIQKLPNGKYKAQITIGYQNGKQVRKSITGSKTEVVLALNQFKADKLKGTLTGPNAITFETYAKRWLEIKKGSAIKLRSYVTYEDALTRHILPFFKDYRIQKITTGIINDYIMEKTKAEVASNTLIQHKSIIHSVLEAAISEGIIGSNPTSNAITITRRKTEKSILSEEEMTRLLQAFQERNQKKDPRQYKQIYHLVLLALATGMRRGELLGLKWNNIDFAANVINVKENVVEIRGKHLFDTPKTDNSCRSFAVEPEVLAIIKKDLQKPGDPEDNLVFGTKDNKPMHFSTLGKCFKEMLEKAGITTKMSPHNLRHTHVSHLLANGFDVAMVADRIGDDPKTVITTYAHKIPKRDRDAASFIGDKLVIKEKS